MKREFLIGAGALAGTIGALAYPAGAIAPHILVGEDQQSVINTSPTNSSSTNTSPSPSASADATTSTQTGSNGTFTGDAVMTRYGAVQVSVDVTSGKITNVNILQAPSGGRNMQFTNYAVPILIQETLQSQSANISIASGASYTSYGFIQSLQSALSQM
jgi:uncharacterized protein with FMN-binding domain